MKKALIPSFPRELNEKLDTTFKKVLMGGSYAASCFGPSFFWQPYSFLRNSILACYFVGYNCMWDNLTYNSRQWSRQPLLHIGCYHGYPPPTVKETSMYGAVCPKSYMLQFMWCVVWNLDLRDVASYRTDLRVVLIFSSHFEQENKHTLDIVKLLV